MVVPSGYPTCARDEVHLLVGELRSHFEGQLGQATTNTRLCLALQEKFPPAATKSTCTPTKTQHTANKDRIEEAPKSWEEPRAQGGEGPVREGLEGPNGEYSRGRHEGSLLSGATDNFGASQWHKNGVFKMI